jgi:hypothetical protein
MTASRPFLWSVLLVAAALRLALALSGGQEFFGDEIRARRGYALYDAVRTGAWDRARLQLVRADHPGFTYVVAAIAPLHHGLAQFTRHGEWKTWADIAPTLGIGAALLGLFSVAALGLVARLARAAGGDDATVGWTLLLAAASTSLLFYSRHLVPYDAALCAGLAALWLALAKPSLAGRLGSGACAGAAFMIYHGYWFFGPLTALALAWKHPAARWWRDGVAWALGGLLVVLLVWLPGALLEGADYWRAVFGFSGSITHGDFAEGGTLPFAFWWATEGWLGLGLAALLGTALGLTAARGVRWPKAAALWAILLAGGYALLAGASWAEKFVVYGRTARALTPFVCLLGGIVLARLTRTRRTAQFALLALIIAGAGANFAPHLRQRFPADVARAIRAENGGPRETVSYAAVDRQIPPPAPTRPDLVLVNAAVLHPLGRFVGYPPGEVLLDLPHPGALPAYQFEGYTPRERAELATHPPRLRLVRIAPSAN